MRLAVPMRKPFEALEEALAAAGVTIVRDPADGPIDALVVDFCDAARHPLAARGWRRTLAPGRPLVAIARDAPWHKGVRRHKLWLLDTLGAVDLYASHSLQDAARHGRAVLYLPSAARLPQYGLRAATLEALRDPARYRHAVSFIGNLDDARYPEHRERVAFLRALAERLARDDIALDLVDSSAGLAVEEQVRIMQSSRINLNHGAACDQGGEKSWGLPERCYGIAACGGFLLSDARRHAADDFVPGREWADYADLESCVARVRHFLAHFDEARAIAEAAHVRVMRDHIYARRAATLLGAIAQWGRR